MAPGIRQRNAGALRKESRKLGNRKINNRVDDSPPSTHPPDGGIIYPSGETAFKALLSARFCAAVWSNISDCDETYNYWEPSHYMLYGKGFQTWEYSPEFALRSYTYLLVNIIPAWFYSWLCQTNRLLVFYFSRCLFGLMCAFCEVYFYKSICREFGIQVGRLTLVFLIFSAGMFISSTAFLPSSFSMYMCLLSMGAWFQRKYELAIWATALSAFLSWPFAGLLGVPIAIDLLFRRKEWLRFFRFSAISAIAILPIIVYMDSSYYGRFVLAPFNIVRYNVLTSHGPDLYGTEPWTFYFINTVLNFNFVAVGAMVAPIALILLSLCVKSQQRHPLCIPYWLSLMPLYLWCAVFFLQPHKEERFLFPVYPLICLGGAVTVDVVQKMWFRFWVEGRGSSRKSSSSGNTSPTPAARHYLQHTAPIMIAAMVVTSLLGLSRILTLYKGYHAPMDVLMELHRMDTDSRPSSGETINVCFGKEWHRFPSSFFLPSDRWEPRFIRSEFRGQLPGRYSHHSNATAIIPEHMNDMNREEPSRYFPLEKCHFLVDSYVGLTAPLEPNYAAQNKTWTVIKAVPFMNVAMSHRLLRAFYIPFLSEQFCDYGFYYLLQSVKLTGRRLEASVRLFLVDVYLREIRDDLNK